MDETICHQVFDFTTPKTILKSKLFALIDVATSNSLEQFQLVDIKLKLFAPVLYWILGLKYRHVPKLHSVRKIFTHSKWDLVGNSGGSPWLENAVERWSRLIEPICFSVYFDASLYFFTYKWIHGLVHQSEMQPIKSTSEPVKNVQASPWNPPKE